MKLARLSAAFGALALCAGAAAAQSASLNQFRPKVLPVLVQVNSHGKITAASPAFVLSPNLSRLLRQNLDEMISHPATDKHGHAISSQFIMNLALQATPRSEGDYNAQFAYVSTASVPAGSWYWVHIDGHRLALAPQHPGNARRGAPFDQGQYSPWNSTRYAPASTRPASQAINQAPLASQAPPARSSERTR